MTVGELIAELSEYDPDLEVKTLQGWGDSGSPDICLDAYTKTVWL